MRLSRRRTGESHVEPTIGPWGQRALDRRSVPVTAREP
jgi:hypothetical protein